MGGPFTGRPRDARTPTVHALQSRPGSKGYARPRIDGMVPAMNSPTHDKTPGSAAAGPAGAASAGDERTTQDECARQMLEAMDATRDAPAELAGIGADLDTGLAIQQHINQLRLDRGEKPVGFKIGFTNRTIWPLYGVKAPIWAPVWDRTAHAADDGSFDASALVSRLNRPRLEPEIVLGLRAAPAGFDPARGGPTAVTLAELEDAIEWVAHGYELVQSPWPDWKFGAGQAMASQSLHGALIVGPRRRVRQARGLAAALSALTIALHKNEEAEAIARGRGSDVLDGPVQALGHWLHEARQRPARIEPAAGMMITTGTLTDAQAVTAGQRWQTRLADEGGALATCLDAPLADLLIRL